MLRKRGVQMDAPFKFLLPKFDEVFYKYLIYMYIKCCCHQELE